MTGNDSLCPLPLITAADSVDLGGRTRPNTLHRIVARFAEKFGHACLVTNQFVAINRKFAPSFALPILERLYSIVETRDCHAPFAIVERGEQLRKRRD